MALLAPALGKMTTLPNDRISNDWAMDSAVILAGTKPLASRSLVSRFLLKGSLGLSTILSLGVHGAIAAVFVYQSAVLLDTGEQFMVVELIPYEQVNQEMATPAPQAIIEQATIDPIIETIADPVEEVAEQSNVISLGEELMALPEDDHALLEIAALQVAAVQPPPRRPEITPAITQAVAKEVEAIIEEAQPASTRDIGAGENIQQASLSLEITAASPSAQNPKPRYPARAIKKGMEGRVILRVEVLPSGQVGGLNILKSSGHSILDKAALKTVRLWQFQPAFKMGITVASMTDIPVVFRLED